MAVSGEDMSGKGNSSERNWNKFGTGKARANAVGNEDRGRKSRASPGEHMGERTIG